MAFWFKRLASMAIAILLCFVIDFATHRSLDSYGQRIVALVGIYVTLAVSLNLINGITGQFSIGHAAFYQVGAYLSGYISRVYIFEHGHHPSLLLWLLMMMFVAAAGASVAGFVVGLPSLRLKGDYLAIVTLGFGEIIRILVQNTDALGGAYALDKIPKIHAIWLVWLLAFICIAVCRNLLRTARGLTYLAVREDEIASSAMGVNVTSVKVTAFVLGSAFAGAAGALLAHYEGLITPATFTMDVSFIILTMVVLGGTGSITGSVFAAIFLSYLPEYLRTLKGADGQALVVTGTAVVASLAATVIAVASIKAALDNQGLAQPIKRTLAYLSISLSAVLLPTLAIGLALFVRNSGNGLLRWTLSVVIAIGIATVCVKKIRDSGALSQAKRRILYLATILCAIVLLPVAMLVGAVVVTCASPFFTWNSLRTVRDTLATTAPIRGFMYGGIIVGAVLLEWPISALLHPVHYLASMQIEAAQLRMVIFAVSLIVIMLLRPQGVFAHHEFSWDWVKKLLGKSPVPATEVAA